MGDLTDADLDRWQALAAEDWLDAHTHGDRWRDLAREAVPALVAEVRRLRAEMEAEAEAWRQECERAALPGGVDAIVEALGVIRGVEAERERADRAEAEERRLREEVATLREQLDGWQVVLTRS